MNTSTPQGHIFVITGPSGVGKGTLCQLLLQANSQLRLSISATSRPQRENEADGVNYFFKSRSDFERMIASGDALLEWAEYNGNYYGTPRAYVESVLASGAHILLEIETQGALMVKQQYPSACLIFVAPPNMSELEARLRGRGTNTDDDIERRLKIAKEELGLKGQFDYTVINRDLEVCFQEIRSIIQAGTVVSPKK